MNDECELEVVADSEVDALIDWHEMVTTEIT